MRVSLRMTEEQHQQLHAHLHPGDGREAVAWLLCGRRRDEERGIICVRQVFPIPHEATRRTKTSVSWKTESLTPLLQAAASMDAPAIVHIHSHPAGALYFSSTDNACDAMLHADLAKIYEDGQPTASLIMLPDGEMIGRSYFQGRFFPMDGVFVVGNLIRRFSPACEEADRTFEASHQQALGRGTTAILRQLRIAIVGCSGTGSVVAELVSRLGAKELILIDPDVVEERNLNRIVNSRLADTEKPEPKVDAIAAAIRSNLGGLAPRIIPVVGTLAEHWRLAATADVLFGCTDSAEGRLHLDLICHHYSMPYIDVGVDLRSDGNNGISYAGAAIHYLRPGGDSLFSRRGYRMSMVQAEALRRTNPELYAAQVKAGYIEGVEEDRPAVISLNMQAASMAVNELLARLHGYRAGDPDDHMVRRVNFVEEFQTSAKGALPCLVMSRHCGLGDRSQPLGLVGLS